MIVNESWFATELCLAMFAAGLLIIALVCGKTARHGQDEPHNTGGNRIG